MTVTAQSLKLRYPEFASQTDTDVQFAIEDAAYEVDSQELSAQDIDRAITNAAAHLMMSLIATRQSGTGQRIRSESFGPISITYDTISGVQADASDFTTTNYGRRYLRILELNLRGPLVI